MKNKKKKVVATILFILLVTALCIFTNTNLETNNSSIDVGEKPFDFILATESDLQIIFFNVGNADCILVKDNADIMLIDAGNEPDGNYIVQYLNDLGIRKINYLIGTHEHEDHVGGMNFILEKFEVENLYLPNIRTNKEYRDYNEVIDVANRKSIEIIVPEKESKFYIGDSICTVKYIGYQESNPNNNSIVIELENNDNKYLFTGDIEEKVEKNVIWDDIDVLKVSHHGSDTSTSMKFLETTKPEISIISTGTRKNLLDNIILQRLQDIKSNKVYITRDLGSVYLTNKNDVNVIKILKTKVDSLQH